MNDNNNESVEKQSQTDMRFLTYEEAARILKVQRATVRSWVYRGEIHRTVKMGKKSLIPLSEIERFVRERTKIKEDSPPGKVEEKKEEPPQATPPVVMEPPQI